MGYQTQKESSCYQVHLASGGFVLRTLVALISLVLLVPVGRCPTAMLTVLLDSPPLALFGKEKHMFEIIKDKDRMRRLESENNKLRLEKSQLEEALLELAQYVSEVKHGETVPTEDK